VKSETRRLNKITGARKNVAKRYNLTTIAAEMLDKAGEVHGQKSRAVQIGVELLWRTQSEVKVPNEILNAPLIGKTYILPPRTVGLIEALSHEYNETQGYILAACAVLLAPDVRDAERWAKYWKAHPNHEGKYITGEKNVEHERKELLRKGWKRLF
jgi:hypothetical protein